MFWDSIPVKEIDFLFSVTAQTDRGVLGSFPGEKQPGRSVEH
jgi:hypothetical protein